MTIRPSLKATLVAGAALGALATAAAPAMAADLIEPVIIEAPVIETVKPFGGWYIRGDVGYSFNKVVDDFEVGGESKFGGQDAIPLFPEQDLEDGFFVGVGVGGHLGQYLRADITADYQFGGEMSSSLDVAGAGCGAAGDPTCTTGYTADFDAITVMANAYVDFGTYAGITPYVGAGIGFAHVDYGDVTETACLPPVAGGATELCGSTVNPTYVTETQTFNGDSSLRLAWSLAAGASYDVNDQFAIDGGYRFVRIEDGDISHTLAQTDGGIDMHQVRVGARVKLH